MPSVSSEFGYTGVNGQLFDALFEGNTDAIKAALEAGADPNARSSNDETLLSLALEWLSARPTTPAHVRLLLQFGADLTKPHFGANLDSAVHSDNVELVELLQQEARPDWNVVGDWRPVGPTTILDDLDADIAYVKAGGNTSLKSRPRDLTKKLQIRQRLVAYGAKKYAELV